jgi:hypothetical protein
MVQLAIIREVNECFSPRLRLDLIDLRRDASIFTWLQWNLYAMNGGDIKAHGSNEAMTLISSATAELRYQTLEPDVSF